MIVEIPQEYKNSGLFIDTMHEEDALCRLWAFLSIFPWHNPTPHYIALMIETELNYPILTDSAKKSARTLQTISRDNNIGVIAIHCKKISDKKGLIEARTIEW